MTTTIIATYRLPRENGQPSRVLTLTQVGDDLFTMAGGRTGNHTLAETDHGRVRAHWAGYCSNNRGHAVKPAAPRFQAAATPPPAAAPCTCVLCGSTNVESLGDATWECYACGDTFLSTADEPAQEARILTADGIDITTTTELRALQAKGNLERRQARAAARKEAR